MRIRLLFNVLAVSALIFGSFSSVQAIDAIEIKPDLTKEFVEKKIEEIKKEIKEDKVSSDKTNLFKVNIGKKEEVKTEVAVSEEAPKTSKKRSLSFLVDKSDNTVMTPDQKKLLCHVYSKYIKELMTSIQELEDELALQKSKSVFFTIDKETSETQYMQHAELGRLKKDYRHFCN